MYSWYLERDEITIPKIVSPVETSKMSIWQTPQKNEAVETSKSIFDDINDTPTNTSKPNLTRLDSVQSSYNIILPHTVAVFGYDANEEHSIEKMLRDVGNVVDVRKDSHCMYLTYSTHVGAENAIKYHKSIIGKTRIAVELQKVENKVVHEPLQRSNWLSWIGLA